MKNEVVAEELIKLAKSVLAEKVWYPKEWADYKKRHPDTKIKPNIKKLENKEDGSSNSQKVEKEEDHPQKKEDHATPHQEHSSPEHQEHVTQKAHQFFKKGAHKANSPERKSLGKHIKEKSKVLLDHLVDTGKEWKNAAKAVGKLIGGERMSHEEKHAIKAVVTEILGATAIMVAAGHAEHMEGAAEVFKHLATDIGGTTLILGLKKMVNSSGYKVSEEKGEKPSPEEKKNLQILIEKLADIVASGDIGKDQWKKALGQLNGK